jgi:hypothetical protein
VFGRVLTMIKVLLILLLHERTALIEARTFGVE